MNLEDDVYDLSRNQAFIRLAERAYAADPERTDRDLRDLGASYLAARLRIDHQTGRLQANLAILEPPPQPPADELVPTG